MQDFEHSTAEDLSESEEPAPPKKSPKPKLRNAGAGKIAWSDEETRAIVDAIIKRGPKWSEVRRIASNELDPKRDQHAVRDRFRNILLNGQISEYATEKQIRAWKNGVGLNWFQSKGIEVDPPSSSADDDEVDAEEIEDDDE